MHSLAAKVDEDALVQELGVVVGGSVVSGSVDGRDAGMLLVRTSKGRYRAKPAFSCLVAPEPGDRVLLAMTETGAGFVLAVLERTSDAPAVLTTPGDLKVRLPHGRFSVASTEGVDLTTTADLNLVARELGVRASEGRLSIDVVGFVGKVADVGIDRVKSLFGLVDTVAERVSQTVKRSYRFVEEIDVTRAAQIDMRAEANLQMRGRNTILSAEQLVKMDGEQIHLG